jgi:1-deoxy-D-xylulose-5-phosphate reductoisomerase
VAHPTASTPPSGPRQGVVLLGATGSIGASSLRVIASHGARLALVGIAARTDWRRLSEIAREFSVRNVAIFDSKACAEARRSGAFAGDVRILEGAAGLAELATLPDARTVLVAVVGTAGLEPAMAAIAAGKDLALASKEILVLAGRPGATARASCRSTASTTRSSSASRGTRARACAVSC